MKRGKMEPKQGFENEDVYLDGKMSLEECHESCQDVPRARKN